MSRRNKVNPDHYTIAGRLSPDDIARERRKQSEHLFGATRGKQRKPVPPWLANDINTTAAHDSGSERDEAAASGDMADSEDAVSVHEQDVESEEPQRKPRAASKGRRFTHAGTTRGARPAKAKPRATGAATKSAKKKAKQSPKTAKSATTARKAKSAKSAKKVKSAKKAKKATKGKKVTKAKQR